MARDPAFEREALRQQMLLRALWRDARPGVVAGWLRDDPQRLQRGLQAYQANAAALAERALGAAYPVLQQLIGEASFAALARAFWHRHPPQRGDIGCWGDALPRLLADSESLADEPYLADVARLEWALHAAAGAADAPAQGPDLQALSGHDPARLRLRCRASLVLIESPHPIVSVWRAHQAAVIDSDETTRFGAVREAFAAGCGEAALVWRQGLRPVVDALAAAEAAFMHALLEGQTLARAFSAAGADFNFEPWLIQALQQGWIAAVDVLDGSTR